MNEHFKLKLYAVAVFAMKPDASQTHTGCVVKTGAGGAVESVRHTFRGIVSDENNTMDWHFGMQAGVEIEETPEAAEQAALDEAKRLYPELQGWVAHRAYTQEIDRKTVVAGAFGVLLDLMDNTPEKASPKDERNPRAEACRSCPDVD